MIKVRGREGVREGGRELGGWEGGREGTQGRRDEVHITLFGKEK